MKSAIRNLQSAILLLCLCGLLSSAHASQAHGGANAGSSLRFTPSARAAAMGDAFGAAATGVAAAHYNPAGLAWTEERELTFLYQNLVLDVGQGAIGFAQPLGPRSAWAVLGQYVDYGTTQRTVVSGLAGATQGTFTGQDLSLGVSYGSRMGNFGYGATARFFSSQIDNAAATAFATDFGMRWQGDSSPIALGVSLKNLGTALQYDRASERLPAEFRLGAAWQAIAHRLLFTADAVKVVREDWSLNLGTEYQVTRMFSLRAGYDGSIDIDNGITLGAGFHSNGLLVDYAWVPFGKVGDNHRLGLGYRF